MWVRAACTYPVLTRGRKRAGFAAYTQVVKNEPTLVKKTEIARRRFELSRLVSQGVRRHAELAERLGVSERTVRRDLEEMERDYSERGVDAMVAVQNRERMVSWQRLEDAVQELQPMIRDPKTRVQGIRLLKEIEERRAKLLGLDMPTKTAPTDPTGQREYTGIPPRAKARIFGTIRTADTPIVDHEPLR